MSVREGFLVVSATWLMAAGFAALPYVFAGGDQLGHPIDAYFEGMSGFTTTGASVVTDYDELSRSLLMWRQFTQWLGGMGIIVLAIAVLPRLHVGGRQLMESELPGPEIAQLSERIRDTARRLWILYVALTALLTLALATLGWLAIDAAMTPYEALAHAFSTMPTGGFSTQPDSIAGFSAQAQWIIALFMIVAGANFAILYRGLVQRRPEVFARDEEFRLYVAILVVAVAFLAAQLWAYDIAEGEEALRQGVFQVASIMTTTGFRERRLRALAGAPPAQPLCADVRRRLGRIDRRLDQGRPSSPAGQGPSARARPDVEPRGRHADPAERRRRGRADAPRDRRLHPPVHRCLGRRSRASSRSTLRSRASS